MTSQGHQLQRGERRRIKRAIVKARKGTLKELPKKLCTLVPSDPKRARKLKAVAKKITWLTERRFKKFNQMSPEAQRAASRLVRSKLGREVLAANPGKEEVTRIIAMTPKRAP
jgi:hypothetical protein